jgi:heme-degrading monooxygenase HmoA
MIARHWTGATRREDAEAYERLLRETVLPGLDGIEGYQGGYVLRRDIGDEVEFVVVNLFASLDAVRAFAGPDYETAVFEPEARRLLSRAEPRALHFEVRHRQRESSR